MRRRVCMMLLASLGIVALVYCADVVIDHSLCVTTTVLAAPPPLVVDKSAPLLLATPKGKEPETDDPWAVPKGPVANNTACFVCHRNYDEEPFAVAHAEANVGCIKCHGESFAHRDDEDNITPPDVMFPADGIKVACEKCHDEHDVAAVEVIQRWQQRCPVKTDPKDIVCTDCHGQHRLKFRTVWWDKKTGKLIIRKEGERIKKATDLAENAGEDQEKPSQPED